MGSVGIDREIGERAAQIIFEAVVPGECESGIVNRFGWQACGDCYVSGGARGKRKIDCWNQFPIRGFEKSREKHGIQKERAGDALAPAERGDHDSAGGRGDDPPSPEIWLGERRICGKAIDRDDACDYED